LFFIKALQPLPTPTSKQPTHPTHTTPLLNNNTAPQLEQLPQQLVCNTVHTKPTTKVNSNYYAILDSGASDNYLTKEAPTVEKTVKHQPIQVTIPDGRSLKSSHKAKLPNQQLPNKARESYIIPRMKNHSLISVVKLCEAGCKVFFGKNECSILYNGMEIIKGRKNATNGLWYIPITDDKHQPQYIPVYDDTQPNAANNVYQTSTMSETIQFLHQCLFSPTVDTLCKAIDNNQLIGFPFLTSSLVQKYLPESTATAKGHMNRNRKNLRSTTNSPASNKHQLNKIFDPQHSLEQQLLTLTTARSTQTKPETPLYDHFMANDANL
jgi:hypothetical protein